MDASLRQHLLSHDEQFKQLAQEHTQHSLRLDKLSEKARDGRFLTEEEKLEEVRLKKIKLRLKDQMENIEQQHRRNNNAVA